MTEASTDGKKPRYWEQRGPNEQWTRVIPSVQVSQAMYEALQEISTSAKHEFGGKMAPVIREALEEFIDRYGVEGPGLSFYQQLKAFRDHWIEEIIANDLLSNVVVIETTLDRWRQADDGEKVVSTFKKLIESVKSLPQEWRGLVIERIKESRACIDAMNYLYDDARLSVNEREEVRFVHDILFGDR